MLPLNGRRIAVLESRSSDEIAALVRRLGGVAVNAPTVDAVPCHDDFSAFFDGLFGLQFSIAVFLSGVGVKALIDDAARRGKLPDVIAALRRITLVCRGAKPSAALQRHGVRPRVTTTAPHTTRALLTALSALDVRGRGVALVHSGDRNAAVATDLRARGARLLEIHPYASALPDDIAPVAAVVRDVLARRLDAVLFTNQAQCRHLFEVATGLRQSEGLRLSLNRDVVVGAVGPACAGALRNAGVTPHVVPGSASMASLIRAVADYFDERGGIGERPR